MEIGKLRHRISVEKYTETRGTTGQVLKSYTESTTRWAQIKSLTTRELLQAQQIHAEITHEVWLRHPLDITAKDRVNFENRIFEILGVVNINEEKRFIKLLCKERI